MAGLRPLRWLFVPLGVALGCAAAPASSGALPASPAPRRTTATPGAQPTTTASGTPNTSLTQGRWEAPARVRRIEDWDD